jgi:ABC-type bacteriocin/lantibiotic exporter with double-glycine peptidase domain
MRYIKQKHLYACFPACLAMVANISYDRACRIVDGRKTKRTWENSGVEWKQIDSSYKKAQLYYRKYENVDLKSIKELRQLKNDAILMIHSPHDKEWGHAVVWNNKKQVIFDPSPWPWFKHTYQYVKSIFEIVEVIKCK